jgi:hypothetical protein
MLMLMVPPLMLLTPTPPPELSLDALLLETAMEGKEPFADDVDAGLFGS